jgi:trehalose/maltose hydrolase-like predicted phosphorylase
MAGSLDIMQRCYGGIVTRDDMLSIDPQLPDALTRLTFSIRYRGQALTFDLTHQELKVTARHSSVNAIKIEFKRRVYELEAGGSLTFSLRPQSKKKPRGKHAAA